MALAFTLASWAPARTVPSPAPAFNDRSAGHGWSSHGVPLVAAAAAAAVAALRVTKVTKVARSAKRREILGLGGASAASALMPKVALAKTKEELERKNKSFNQSCTKKQTQTKSKKMYRKKNMQRPFLRIYGLFMFILFLQCHSIVSIHLTGAPTRHNDAGGGGRAQVVRHGTNCAH